MFSTLIAITLTVILIEIIKVGFQKMLEPKRGELTKEKVVEVMKSFELEFIKNNPLNLSYGEMNKMMELFAEKRKRTTVKKRTKIDETMGRCTSKGYDVEIQVSVRSLELGEMYTRRVIEHEVAHYITHCYEQMTGRKLEGHGKEWLKIYKNSARYEVLK